MKEEEPAHDPAEGVPIVDRPDVGGALDTWWPLAALAIICLLLVRACVDAAPAQRPATGAEAPLQRDAPR